MVYARHSNIMANDGSEKSFEEFNSELEADLAKIINITLSLQSRLDDVSTGDSSMEDSIDRHIATNWKRLHAIGRSKNEDLDQSITENRKRLAASWNEDQDSTITRDTKALAARRRSGDDQPQPTPSGLRDSELELDPHANLEIRAMHDMFLDHRRIPPTTSCCDIQQRHILLAKAFAWGQQHSDLHFRDAIVDEIISISKLPDPDTKVTWSPGALPIRIIYDSTQPGDKARQLMVHLYSCLVGGFWPSDGEDDFCKSFLFDLARHLLSRKNPVNEVTCPGLGPESAIRLSSCFWHEHLIHGKRCWKVRTPEVAPASC